MNKSFFVRIVLLVACFTVPSSVLAAVSEQAQRHFDRGLAAVEIASAPEDYVLAIKEFEEAVKLAPAWPEAYYNLGIVQEKAGQFRAAASALRQYLQLAPEAPDAATVRSLVSKSEFKAEQVITDEDVLDIFGSLGDRSIWQFKGTTSEDSTAPDQLRGMQIARRAGPQIIITYWRGPGGTYTETRSVTPQGKTLSFETIYYLCDPSVQKDMCPDVSSYRLESVSKSKIKMSRKRFGPEIKPYIAAEVNDYSYEFVRK